MFVVLYKKLPAKAAFFVLCTPPNFLMQKYFYIHYMKIAVMFALWSSWFLTASAQKDVYLLLGTYTAGTSHGIYVYNFNTGSAVSRLLDSAKIASPSYLAISPNEKYVYSVSEEASARQNGGSVAAFAFNKQNGSLLPLNRQGSQGNNPCYVAIDKTGRWVLTGNYSSGSLAALPVLKNGFLDSAVSAIEHTGSGVNTDRQNEPHVHATVFSPDNKYVLVPDLGMDKLMIYAFNKRTGALTPAATPFVMTKPGSGPRHLEFHPNKKFVYLIEELTGSISAYRYFPKNGALELLQNISNLPPEFMGYPGSADIHVSPDGRFLYASNRGESNTIAIFSIDKKTGQLTAIGHQSTMGKTPRNFNFDPTGNWLLVANQESNEVVIFKIDKATGLLTDSGKRIGVSKPVCVKWVMDR